MTSSVPFKLSYVDFAPNCAGAGGVVCTPDYERFKSVAFTQCFLRYDTIRYDNVCLTCSKKLTGSQLSLPHGTNKKLKCKTKNKMMSMIGPVQSRYREAVE